MAEVLVSTEPFVADGEVYPAGTKVEKGHKLVKGREALFRQARAVDVEKPKGARGRSRADKR